jgi:bifunctional non-homologous end joining protein LigD
MLLRKRTRPGLGFVEPCLPSPANAPPSGPGWIHEIKHDGFRIIARRDGAGVRLFTRKGHDLAARFPLAAAAIAALPAHSFLIDGEAIVTDDDGLAVFDPVRRQRNGGAAVLCAFDLIELEGEDLRRSPIEHPQTEAIAARSRSAARHRAQRALRRRRRRRLRARLQARLRGHRVEAARLALRSGRSPHWLKVKNPKAPAVKREAEENWGR